MQTHMDDSRHGTRPAGFTGSDWTCRAGKKRVASARESPANVGAWSVVTLRRNIYRISPSPRSLKLACKSLLLAPVSDS